MIFVVDGMEKGLGRLRDSIEADTMEQAVKIFQDKYPDAYKILFVMTADQFNRRKQFRENAFMKTSGKSGAPPYINDTCPICKEKCIGGCRCMEMNGISNERSCKNGHKWYWDNGKKTPGTHHRKLSQKEIDALEDVDKIENKSQNKTLKIKISKSEWNSLRFS